MSITDVLEPSAEPAKNIYLAFQAEAKKRKGRPVQVWTEAEIEVVHKECLLQSQKLGLRAPTMDDVRNAVVYARGSADYGSKWAHQLSRMMTV